MNRGPIATAAQRLRDDFDRAFTLPPPGPAEPTRDFVLVEVDTEFDRDGHRSPEATLSPSSGEPAHPSRTLALPAEQLRGIERVAAVVRVPSSVPALEGVAGLHGVVIPVFRLPGCSARMSERWHASPLLAVVALSDSSGETLAGLAFARLHEFVRVPISQVHAEPVPREPAHREAAQPEFRETVQYQDGLYPIVYPADLLRGMAAYQQEPANASPRHGDL